MPFPLSFPNGNSDPSANKRKSTRTNSKLFDKGIRRQIYLIYNLKS